MGSRRELVFAACNTIAAEAIEGGRSNVRPTARELKSRFEIPGSLPDVQADLHAWFMSAFRNHLAVGKVPGVPETVVAAFNSFLEIVRAEAFEELRRERIDLELERQKIRGELETAKAARDQAIEAALDAERKCERTEISVRHLEQQLGEQRAVDAAKDVRIDGLNNDLARVQVEYTQRIGEVEAQAQLSIERFEAMERKALIDIDRARAGERKLRAEIDETAPMIDAYRQQVSHLERANAALRGQIEALERQLLTVRKLGTNQVPKSLGFNKNPLKRVR